MRTFKYGFGMALAFSLGLHAMAYALDMEVIEKGTGLKGKWNEAEKVFKVSAPRSDIKASVDGIQLTPSLGLTSWAAFTEMGDHVMVMGDTVLLESQVNIVMRTALDKGLEVTALHNHFFWDKPKIFFMHIGGMGNECELSEAVGAVFHKIQETAANPAPSFPKIDTSNLSIDTAALDSIFGAKGEMLKGAYKVTVGRKVSMEGVETGAAMGVNTWAAFAGSDEQALVDGDFAVTDPELQPVLKSLLKSGIAVVAIHNHMTRENPRIIFLHYWGVGRAKELAQAVKSALDTQGK